jgi:homogentisate 1,2-dioxygenase
VPSSNIRRGTIPRASSGISEHLDEIYTIKGFFGDWTHVFRARNVGFPTSWSSDDIMYMGADTNVLQPTDQDDPAGTPLELLKGDGIVVSISHRSEAPSYVENNGDYHQIRFYHRGEFLLETELGRLEMKEGDFVVIPRGIGYRETPKTRDGNAVLIFETEEPVSGTEMLWDNVGFTSFFVDYSAMKLPEPVGEVVNVDTEVRLKYLGKTHTLKYNFDPLTDVIGWFGDPVVYSLNVWDVPGLGTSHGFMPPPAGAVLMGENKSFFFNVLGPKPFAHVPAPDGSYGAPAHRNDYEEVWFKHVSESAPDTTGFVWRLPPSLPHPGIKRDPFYPEGQPTERIREMALNFDTRCALEWTDAAREVFLPDPEYTFYTNFAGTDVGLEPEESTGYAAGRK